MSRRLLDVVTTCARTVAHSTLCAALLATGLTPATDTADNPGTSTVRPATDAERLQRQADQLRWEMDQHQAGAHIDSIGVIFP